MITYLLTSTCDDSGAMLAGRLCDPEFRRVIECYETLHAAECAKQSWLDWYASRGIAIGDGCLAVEEGEGTVMRWGEDGRFATLWNDGKFVRYADHAEMHGNTYTIGDNLTDAEIEALPE